MSGNVWMFSDQIDDEDLEFMAHEFVTYTMACAYYGLGLKPLTRMAHEAGAIYKIGTKVLIRRSIFESYLREQRKENTCNDCNEGTQERCRRLTMKLNYTEINGYLIPDLIFPETDTRPIGKYGELRRQFLREHRPDMFDLMLLEGTLHSHLADVDAAARQMVEDTIEQMAHQQGVDEALKRADPLAWAGRMNAIKNATEEAVLPDLLYGDALE